MNPLHRLSRLHSLLADHPARERTVEGGRTRTAAVAIVLRDGAEGVECLFIRRAEREGDPWSGHMALPGGRHEPADPSLLHTAIRETREEVGLQLTPSQLMGRLDDLEAMASGRRTGLVVRPFVFAMVASADAPLRPNEEVAETLWAPLQPIHEGAWDTVRPYVHEGHTWKLPAWDVYGRVVWGLTHRILTDLLGRI